MNFDDVKDPMLLIVLPTMAALAIVLSGVLSW